MPEVLRRSLLTSLFVVLLAGSIAGPAGATAPSLRIDGAAITDTSTGTEFVPHGVNWPSFEYACQQGWGYSNPGTGPEAVEAMLGWRINTVRIPLNQDCWLGDDGLPASDGTGAPLSSIGYRDAVDAFVERLSDAGIVAMLDLHWSAPPGYPANGLRPMADSRSADFWTSVASRFRDQPGIIFDLFNEPHSRWDPNLQKSPPGSGTGDWDFRMTWDIWANGGGFATNHPDSEYPFVNPRFETAGMTGLVEAVRATGAGQPVVLSGIDYANDVTGWRQHAPPDDQLIAGFHNYPGQRCNSKDCWYSEVAQLNLDVPVITTEFGQNDCSSDHLDRFMDWADDHHIGYLAWAWWDLDMGPGTLPCTNYALIDDLDGTPTPGYGESFRNHLISLPEILPPKVDANPPQTTIDSGPTGTTGATPTFEFSSSEPGSSFECRVDSDAFSSCSSPETVAALTDGPHTFEVKATDAAGNTDSTPATQTFAVDATAPDTTIDSGPSGPTGDATPSFGFSSSEPGSSFECRVDSDAFSTCSSPETVAALTDGPHSFEARATDSVGNTDPTPPTQSFTIDTTAPDTQIDSGPTGTIAVNEATFTFSGSPAQDTAKIQCRIDSEPFADCTSPKAFTGLSDGPHTAEFRAEDAVGNQDASPATRSFTVDTTVYKAKIGKVKVTGPAKVKRGKKTTYKVKVKNSGNAAATGVRLKVKGKGIKAKKSVGKISGGKTKTVKIRLKPKKPGKIKVSFKVTSKNAGGKTVKKRIKVKK